MRISDWSSVVCSSDLLSADDFFAGPVAAALGADLVFDVAGGRTELDQAFHGTRDVERRGAEAGIDVDDQRHIADVGDAAYIGKHVVQRIDTQVGQTQRAGRYATARQVDGAVSGA